MPCMGAVPLTTPRARGTNSIRNQKSQQSIYRPTHLSIYFYKYAPLVCVDQVLEHKRRDLRAQGVVVQDRLEHHAAALAQRLGRRVGPRQRRRAVAVGGQLEEPRRRCDSLCAYVLI